MGVQWKYLWPVLVLAAMTVNALEDHNTDLDSPARGISWLMIATVAFAVVPVKDGDTGSWSLGVLKNPGQYCAVLGFGLLGLLLYRYLCQQAPIAPICFKNGSVLTQYGRLDQLNPTQYNVFYDLSHWTVP